MKSINVQGGYLFCAGLCRVEFSKIVKRDVTFIREMRVLNIFIFSYIRCQKCRKRKNEKWNETNINPKKTSLITGAYAVANVQVLFRVLIITITAVFIDRKTHPILEFFEELWWIDVIWLVLFMLSAIFYYILVMGLSKFKRWMVGFWMAMGLVEIFTTISKL